MAVREWALLIGWILFIWWAGWRVLRRMWSISFVIIALVVAGFLGWQTYLEYSWQHNEQLYAKAVEPITGKGKDVHCQRLLATWFFAGGEAGHVLYSSDNTISNEAWLTWQTCHDLGMWMGSDKTHPTLEQITAIHVLSHEAQHLAGVRSEAVAECNAMGKDAFVARQLGATPAEAAVIQKIYNQQVYPNMSMDYQLPGCLVYGQ